MSAYKQVPARDLKAGQRIVDLDGNVFAVTVAEPFGKSIKIKAEPLVRGILCSADVLVYVRPENMIQLAEFAD